MVPAQVTEGGGRGLQGRPPRDLETGVSRSEAIEQDGLVVGRDSCASPSWDVASRPGTLGMKQSPVNPPEKDDSKIPGNTVSCQISLYKNKPEKLR